MIISAIIGMGTRREGPNLMVLSWSALFLSLGWNFLEFGLGLRMEGGAVIAWLICAVLFIPMGAIPLWIILRAFGRGIRNGSAGDTSPIWRDLIFQILLAAAGIYLGIVLFRAISQSPAN